MTQMPVPILSTEILRLHDSLDAVRVHAESLAWHVGQFPAHGTEHVDDQKLQIVLDLSLDIVTNINKIQKMMRYGQPSNVPSHRYLMHTHSKDHEQKQSKNALENNQLTWKMGNVKLQCHICATQDTPKWRSGPAGPGSLCNVCGLVFAKRQDRLKLAVCSSSDESGSRTTC